MVLRMGMSQTAMKMFYLFIVVLFIQACARTEPMDLSSDQPTALSSVALSSSPTSLYEPTRAEPSPTLKTTNINSPLPVLPTPTKSRTAKTRLDGPSGNPSISADGRFIAFESDASNLVPDDHNNESDIFVYDRVAATLERISKSSDGVEANGESFNPSLSADGRYIAFMSWASNLVANDTNQLADPPPTNAPDIFVRDRATGKTERVSLASDGTQANERSDNSSISGNGRWVVFVSWATNLVSDDTNGTPDVFVHDRETGITERVSIASGGDQGNGWSYAPVISEDGNSIAFVSQAKNLAPDASPQFCSVFVHNRTNHETSLVSVDEENHVLLAGGPSLSANASKVGFWNNNVYMRDLELAHTVLVASNVLKGGNGGNCNVGGISLSGDGRWIAYASQNPTGNVLDVFLFALDKNQYTQITGGNASSNHPALSADGRWLAFQSRATNLTIQDTNKVQDIFLYDRVTEKIILVSKPSK